MRHFPQSFEFSTLGGWLATRAGGHYATLHTHVDDFVESLRVVTPVGISESLRLPGSGAGPSPDRLFLGSEGALGVITEAWLRIQDRPTHTASTSVRFASFADAVGAARAIAQSGLHPANCRLLDPGEAMFSGAGEGMASVLVLGFESAFAPVDDRLALAVGLAEQHGGTVRKGSGEAVESWRSAFLRMPYLRDGLARMSALVETFETATTWDRVLDLIDAVRTSVGAAVREVCGAEGIVNCRFTHVYPDGAAPYFTVIAPGTARIRAGAVGRAEDRGKRDVEQARRDDHPPPRRRPRPPPLVRPPTAGRVRDRVEGDEARAGPGRNHEPGRPTLTHRRSSGDDDSPHPPLGGDPNASLSSFGLGKRGRGNLWTTSVAATH